MSRAGLGVADEEEMVVIGDNNLMTVVVEELFTKDFKEGLILN